MTKYFQHLIQQTGFQAGVTSVEGIETGHSPSNQSAPLIRVEDQTRFVPPRPLMNSADNLTRGPTTKFEKRIDEKKPIDQPVDPMGDGDISTEVPDRSPEIKDAPSLGRVEEVKSSGHSPTQTEEVQGESSQEFIIETNQFDVEEGGEETSPEPPGEIRKKIEKVEAISEVRLIKGEMSEGSPEKNSVDEQTGLEKLETSQEKKGIDHDSPNLKAPESTERTLYATLNKVREWVSETLLPGEIPEFEEPIEVEERITDRTSAKELDFSQAVQQDARPEMNKSESAKPEIHDFQFSIGSINLTIEETPLGLQESPSPREAPNQPAPSPNNSSRLRRHYLKVR